VSRQLNRFYLYLRGCLSELARRIAYAFFCESREII
jgi:hypothetical protein